jgi:large subunit ribosomal protein L6
MSRIGKKPVQIPAGVEAHLSGQEISVKGKLGQLRLVVNDETKVTLDGNVITMEPKSESRLARNMWATSRTLVANMVRGVSEGFRVNLEINGVGYRAAVQGQELVLSLGYSHEIRYPIPDGITIRTEKPTLISITGFDKPKVGQVAAEIRRFRGPEPFKGKGIKYEGETILRKEGKKK